MNPSAVKQMSLESDRRLGAEGLAKLLLTTPIILVTTRGSKLRARMGLGHIVYIQPIKGQIKDVKLGDKVYNDAEHSSDANMVFDYKEQRFDVQYHP